MRISRIIVLLFVVIAAFGCARKKEEKMKPLPEVNEYPAIVLKFNNSEEVSARALDGNNVFVFFQPDCDHCQEEAVFIGQRLADFKDYTLYFISSAPMEEITAFAETFELGNKDNVRFAWSSTDGVLSHYGPIKTPSIYIYSNGRLKQSFNGKTDIENILGAL